MVIVLLFDCLLCYNAEYVLLLCGLYNILQHYAKRGQRWRADRGGSYGGGIMAKNNANKAKSYYIIYIIYFFLFFAPFKGCKKKK